MYIYICVLYIYMHISNACEWNMVLKSKAMGSFLVIC